MVDCYHYARTKTEDGNTYCTKCSEFLEISPTTHADVTVGSLGGSYEVAGSTMSIVDAICKVLRVDAVSIPDVTTSKGLYGENDILAKFRVGSDRQMMEALVKVRFSEEVQGTGRFLIDPLEAPEAN